ncbi:hypothetical protein K2173_025423 [Erythroxylum novogranatense]|uniref:NAD-dependent epimerase/dehydratase domain-containing protein n=1 Tax=Erythroxylum novogranatense TaxID=1862640 RepID=A0AAV8UGN8_9ROSI|nr:hypothetical protein K2173_025423 [Erythroxylum novogranatense]
MSATVCVTGAAGHLGSYLVKRLLQKGYTVHATTRNLGDEKKVGLLKALPQAETGLKLFEADIYKPEEFAAAVEGCEAVIHMATPLEHDSRSSQFKNTSEAAVAGVKSIVESCLRSGTVKKLIYTASVTAASPMEEDGTGFKDSMDESCWTPFHLSFPYATEFLTPYVSSKTLSEQEVLRYNGKLEVVSLACGLVGGDALVSTLPVTTGVMVSQATMNKELYHTLRFLEELMGKIPLVHVEDVCEAHIFCIDKPSITGRFLVANAYLSSAEIGHYWERCNSGVATAKEYMETSGRKVEWGSTKLRDLGFEYKHDVSDILNDSLKCAREKGQP